MELFPSICSNNPTSSVNKVYISELISYSVACGSYHDVCAATKEVTEPIVPSG